MKPITAKKTVSWPMVVLLLAVLLPVLTFMGLKRQQSQYPDWVTPAWYTFTQKSGNDTLALDLWGNRTLDGTEIKVHLGHGGPNQKWGVIPIAGTTQVHLHTAQGKCIGAEGKLLRQVNCTKAVPFTVRTRTAADGQTEVQFVDPKGQVAGLPGAEPAADFTLGVQKNAWWAADRVWGTGPHFPLLEYAVTPWVVVGVFALAASVSLWFLWICLMHLPVRLGFRLPFKTPSRMAPVMFLMTCVQLGMMAACLVEVWAMDATVAMWGRTAQGILQFWLAALVFHMSLQYSDYDGRHHKTLQRVVNVFMVAVLVVFIVNPAGWVHSNNYHKELVPPVHLLKMDLGPIWNFIDLCRTILVYFAFAVLFFNYQFLSRFFQVQTTWMAMSIFVPSMLGWVVWQFQLIPIAGLDTGYVVGVALPAWFMVVNVRMRVLEVTPVSVTSLIVREAQPTVAVDHHGTITSMNHAAQQLFPEYAPHVPLPLHQATRLQGLLSALQHKKQHQKGEPHHESHLEDLVEAHTHQGQTRYLTLMESSLAAGGRAFTLVDVTKTALVSKKLEETNLELRETAIERNRELHVNQTLNEELQSNNQQLQDKTSKLQRALEDLAVAIGERDQAIEDLREAHQKVALQAVTDHLTRWKNRQGFADDWKELNRALFSEENMEQLACIYFDVDNFRTFNQANHLVGDEVLRKVSRHILQQLQSLLGQSQTLAYRMSGEEFCVLVPGMDLQSAVGLAEALRSTLASETFEVKVGEEQQVFNVTASFGVAATPEHDVHTLLLRADAAAAEAKARGKNQVFEHPYYVPGWDD